MIPESVRYKLNINVMAKSTQTYFRRMFDALFDNYAQNPNRRTFSSQMMSSLISDETARTGDATKGFTKREIIANSILVILAGHETTASTLQFVLYHLVAHPTIQEQLYESVKDVDVQNYEQVRDCRYLDAIIKESMRLFAVAPFGLRTCTETTDIAEGVTVERGTVVMWSSHNIHMDPNIHHEPHMFNPARWEGNESITLQDDAWFAFGQGPRSCPG